MEPNISETSNSHEGLLLGDNEIYTLNEAAKWGRFLGIIGFIGCGLLVLVSFFARSLISTLNTVEGGQMSADMGGMLTFIYLMGAALYFFPCYYLYNFGTKMKHAVMLHDQHMLQHSFKNLKSCFKFFGILTITILAFYAVATIAMVLGASFFS